MNNLDRYKTYFVSKLYLIRKLTNMVIFASILLCFNYSYASLICRIDQKPIELICDTSLLCKKEWYQLIEYAYKKIKIDNFDIKAERNESGFYRINLPIPKNIASKLKIEKIRLNYWPTDNSNPITTENFHDHPKYFESLIINGGYKHAISDLKISYKNNNYQDLSKSSNKYTMYRINKAVDGKKDFQSMGSVLLYNNREEYVKEASIISMPVSVVHRVLFSIPGSLSMNVIFNKQDNKKYYNVMVPIDQDKGKVSTDREIVDGKLKTKIINEIKQRLFNALFQFDINFAKYSSHLKARAS